MGEILTDGGNTYDPTPFLHMCKTLGIPTQDLDELPNYLSQIVKTVHGTVGLCVTDMEGNTIFSHNSDDRFPMASVCKLPILLALYRKKINLNERVLVTTDQLSLGSGRLAAFKPGINPTLQDLALLMITESDNTATDILSSKLTLEEVNGTMAELGYAIHLDQSCMALNLEFYYRVDPRFRTVQTVSQMKELEDLHPDLKSMLIDTPTSIDIVTDYTTGKDESTPRAMCQLLREMYSADTISEDQLRDAKAILGMQLHNGRLPRLLSLFDAPVCYHHKTGTLGNHRVGVIANDCGVCMIDDEPKAIVSFFSRGNSDPIEMVNHSIALAGFAVAKHFGARVPDFPLKKP